MASGINDRQGLSGEGFEALSNVKVESIVQRCIIDVMFDGSGNVQYPMLLTSSIPSIDNVSDVV